MAIAPRDGILARQQPFVVVAAALFIMILMHANCVQSESSVTIKNVAGSDISLHCKSGDDLGEHTLHDQQQIYWSFKASVWQNTKFVCSFQWSDAGMSYTQDFPVWIDGTEHPDFTCGQCLWDVDGSGFSLWNKDTQSFVHKYNWIPAAAADMYK